MSKAAWVAFRAATAIGIALLSILIFRPESPFRAVLAGYLVVCLPTFRRKMMRQRLILVWCAGILGMALDAFFRDAPWLYIGFFVLMVTSLLIVASRSRDLATMTLLLYGISGSMPNTYNIDSEAIYDGFFRALNCSIGILSASIAFLIFPLRKPPVGTANLPIRFPVRDTFFIAVVGAAAICTANLFSSVITSAFVVFGALTWSIALCTQPREAIMARVVGGICGITASIFFISVICFSTNEILYYLASFIAVVWLCTWVGVQYPAWKPFANQFVFYFMVEAIMVPRPVHNLHESILIASSLYLGVVTATLLWFLDRLLRSMERMMEPPPLGDRIQGL
ncbi:MAG: hypothetical protein WCP60_06335 [bacterium]